MLKYDFHDSLIENVNYFSDKKRVEIEIALCNWRQRSYKNEDPEIKKIYMIFEEVECYKLSMVNMKFDHNTILDIEEIGDASIRIIFLTENDAEIMMVTAKYIQYLE